MTREDHLLRRVAAGRTVWFWEWRHVRQAEPARAAAALVARLQFLRGSGWRYPVVGALYHLVREWGDQAGPILAPHAQGLFRALAGEPVSRAAWHWGTTQGPIFNRWRAVVQAVGEPALPSAWQLLAGPVLPASAVASEDMGTLVLGAKPVALTVAARWATREDTARLRALAASGGEPDITREAAHTLARILDRADGATQAIRDLGGQITLSPLQVGAGWTLAHAVITTLAPALVPPAVACLDHPDRPTRLRAGAVLNVCGVEAEAPLSEYLRTSENVLGRLLAEEALAASSFGAVRRAYRQRAADSQALSLADAPDEAEADRGVSRAAPPDA